MALSEPLLQDPPHQGRAVFLPFSYLPLCKTALFRVCLLLSPARMAVLRRSFPGLPTLVWGPGMGLGVLAQSVVESLPHQCKALGSIPSKGGGVKPI